MPLPRNDADVERIVVRSRLFGAARDLLSWAERACASSASAAILARRWPLPTIARVLAIASVVHAVLVTFEPAASAPFGRYVLAGLGLAASALVAAASRAGEDHVRHLR
jgi:O-antigen/teichoic acid export membrane protein